MSEEFDKVSLKNFANNEVVAVMQNLMKEALKQEVEALEALNNIELLVNTEIIQTDDLIENFKAAFVVYLKDRRNAYAKYLAKEANAKFDDAYALVINLFASGDLQKNMSIETIKAVLDANVLNVSFYDGNKEEKKEEKPKVSEQKKEVMNYNAIMQEIEADTIFPDVLQKATAIFPVGINDNKANVFTATGAYCVTAYTGFSAEQIIYAIVEFERAKELAKKIGGIYFSRDEYVQNVVPASERYQESYTPAPSEKPAQPKGNHAPNNTQQESVNEADMRDRKIIGLSKHTDKGAKGEYSYYQPYYWDADKKQMAAIGRIFTNSPVAKEIAKIVPADVLNSLREMPVTLPESAYFNAYYTLTEKGDKKYSTFHRVEKAGQ